MNDFVDNAMNFINENTTLLIIICVFLICVLIIYLINNSIKSKKLESFNNENVAKVEPVPEINNVVEEKKDEIVVQKIEEPVVEEPAKEVVNEVTVNEEFNPVEETKVDTIEEVKTEEPVVNTIEVEPEVNDILLKDFTKNDNVIEVKDIEKDIVEEKIEPVKEEKPSSMYKNDKKISDIFGKKKEVKNDDKIDENEIDRILARIDQLQNSTSSDSTVEETQDFTNMF